jgi:hypothetical protein
MGVEGGSDDMMAKRVNGAEKSVQLALCAAAAQSASHEKNPELAIGSRRGG